MDYYPRDIWARWAHRASIYKGHVGPYILQQEILLGRILAAIIVHRDFLSEIYLGILATPNRFPAGILKSIILTIMIPIAPRDFVIYPGNIYKYPQIYQHNAQISSKYA